MAGANSLKDVQELLGYIDAIMATIQMYPTLNLEIPFLGNMNGSINVMDLLMMLLQKFCTMDEIIDFLVKMLTDVLPVLELAVKGVILSNLKLSTSCNVDPFIPYEWRQQWVGDELDPYENIGINNDPTLIPVNKIDMWGIFNVDPTSELGQKYYAKSSILYQWVDAEKYANACVEVLLKDGKEHSRIEQKLVYDNAVAEFTSRSYTWLYDTLAERRGTSFRQEEDIVNIGDIDTTYQLARADDMNSFLWFVMNKSLFTKINRTELEILGEGDSIYDDVRDRRAIAYATSRMQFPADGNYMELDEDDLENNTKEIYLSGDIASTTMNGVDSTNYLMCINGEQLYGSYTQEIEQWDSMGDVIGTTTVSSEGIRYKSLLVPCSDRINSYIWYMTNGNIFTRGFKDGTEEEDPAVNMCQRGLCSISYVDHNGKTSPSPAMNGCFRVKVLPAPMIHYRKGFWLNDSTWAEIPFVGKKILFNYEGVPVALDAQFNEKKKSYFTVRPEINPATGKVKNPFQQGNGNYEVCFYNLVNNKNEVTDFTLNIQPDQTYDVSRGSNPLTEDDKLEFVNSCLFPCYPGLTIYEFNWDFVMNTRLFYPKVVAERILTSLLNLNVTASMGLNLSMQETMYQMRVSQIIANLMENETGEVKDCFFEFSNDKFTSMLNEAELKRKNQYPFDNDSGRSINTNGDDILNILNNFKDDAIKHEQTEVLTQAFTQATVSITDEVLPEDRLNIGKNFIIDALKQLGIVCFEALLSPKMLLLFEINRRMSMGQSDKNIIEEIKDFDIEETIKKFAALITSIIAEIMTVIIENITTLVMKKILELTEKLASMLILEQITAYKELIIKIIEACSFSFPMFGHRADLDSNLDVVRYADIDPVEQPKTEEC